MLKLEAGQVYLIFCSWIRTPKDKMHAVAIVGQRLRYFLINSHAAPFKMADAELARHQIDLLESEHTDFLKWNSVLDISEVCGGPTPSALEDLIGSGGRVHLGRVSENARCAVRNVVTNSELLSPVEIRELLSIW